MRCAGRVSDKISANKQDRQNKAQQTYKQPHVPLYPLQMDGKAYVELREDGDTSSAASYRRLSPVAKKLIYFSLAVLFLAGVVIVIVVYAVHTTKAPAPLVSDLNVQATPAHVQFGEPVTFEAIHGASSSTHTLQYHWTLPDPGANTPCDYVSTMQRTGRKFTFTFPFPSVRAVNGSDSSLFPFVISLMVTDGTGRSQYMDYYIKSAYKLEPTTKVLSPTDVVSCTANTVVVRSSTMPLNPNDIIISMTLICGNGTILRRVVSATPDSDPSLIVLQTSAATLEDAIHTLFVNDTVPVPPQPIDAPPSLSSTSTGNQLSYSWHPKTPYSWDPTPDIHLSVEPSVSFTPTVHISFKIFLHVLHEVKVDFEGDLDLSLKGIARASGAFDKSKEYPVYKSDFASIVWVIPGIDLPLYLTPTIDVSVGFNVRASFDIEQTITAGLNTVASGYVEWRLAHGFDHSFGITFDPYLDVAQTCIGGDAHGDAYISPKLGLEVDKFFQFAVTPSPHLYDDVLIPPPSSFRGTPVDCANAAYDALSAGVITKLELGLEKWKDLSWHHTWTYERVLKSFCIDLPSTVRSC